MHIQQRRISLISLFIIIFFTTEFYFNILYNKKLFFYNIPILI